MVQQKIKGMNLRNKLHYVSKRMRSGRKIGAFALLIITAAMIMMYSSLILFEGLDYGENAVKNSLSTPITSCGIIDFQDDAVTNDWIVFIDQLYDLDEIKAIGNYDCYGYSGMTTEGDMDY